jgi:hypothetical protein
MPEPPEDLYLLTWEKVSKAPTLDAIEVDDVQEGNWVVFHYLEAGLRGLKGGAPMSNILTEKEADLVQKTWAQIERMRNEAKKLNRDSKALMESTLEQFSLPDRKVI